MLSIRTQDRMSLVPYVNKDIDIFETIIPTNQNEIDLVKKRNEKLYEEIVAKPTRSYDHIRSVHSHTTYTRRLLENYEKEKEDEPKAIYSYVIKCGKKLLGTYATKERALEVLDEIQTVVAGKILIQQDYSKLHTNKDIGILPQEITLEKIERIPFVYQMPKE